MRAGYFDLHKYREGKNVSNNIERVKASGVSGTSDQVCL